MCDVINSWEAVSNIDDEFDCFPEEKCDNKDTSPKEKCEELSPTMKKIMEYHEQYIKFWRIKNGISR